MRISVCAVQKSYGEKRVLDGWSHEFSGGRVYCLRGPSGSGKTTLLRLLIGLEKCDAGEIVYGMDVENPSAPACDSCPSKNRQNLLILPNDTEPLRRAKLLPKISAVFQEDRLFERLSAEKNVLLTAKAGFTRADATALLKRLDIVDTKKRVGEFSGGMKRRCAIARALAADYDLLILDEPMAGLDEAARRTAMQVIFEENRGRTLICATHFPEFADYFSAQSVEIPLIAGAD